MLQFEIREHRLLRNGTVVYIKNDYSFDFHPRQVVYFHLLIENLHLSLQEEKGLNCACQIGGYHPYPVWVHKTLTLPSFVKGSLILFNDQSEDDDIIRMVEVGEWKTYFDPETGWVCIGSDVINTHSRGVEFASDIIAIVEHQELKSLWIKPLIKLFDE